MQHYFNEVLTVHLFIFVFFFFFLQKRTERGNLSRAIWWQEYSKGKKKWKQTLKVCLDHCRINKEDGSIVVQKIVLTWTFLLFLGLRQSTGHNNCSGYALIPPLYFGEFPKIRYNLWYLLFMQFSPFIWPLIFKDSLWWKIYGLW